MTEAHTFDAILQTPPVPNANWGIVTLPPEIADAFGLANFMPVAVKINGYLFRSTLYLHTLSCNRGFYMEKGILGRVGAKLGHLAHFEIRRLTEHEAASQLPLNIADRLIEAQAQDAFKITLGPGQVRYLKLDDFLAAPDWEWITTLKKLSNSPQIMWPFGLPESLLEGQSWENTLRVQHKFGKLSQNGNLHPWVYRCFHDELALESFEFEECLKAWVKEAWHNNDLTESYLPSSQHIVADGLVFVKTPFVTAQLAKIDAKGTQAENEIAAQRAAEDLDRLRKSGYSTFVYLMEDLRNACFKIGRSKTPGKRERTLQSEAPTVTLRFAIPTDEEHEKHLHAQFEHKNQRGEWFSLTVDDLWWIVSFLKANGDVTRATVDYERLGRLSFQVTK